MVSVQKNFCVLREEDILRHQMDDIERVSVVLSITEVEASFLLRHYHWSVGRVHDEWFADEERVRNTVGLLESPVVPPSDDTEVFLLTHGLVVLLTCGICFDSYPPEQIASVSCGHPFCTTCWTGYISTTINGGPGCLMLRCPDPSCLAAVGHDMVDQLASEEDKKKYNRYFLRSYIEDNRKMKWCPAPGCDYAIDFVAGSGNYDVSCLCSFSFCWNCTEEAHRPVDCITVSKWILKNSAESENMNWILANSKPCPRCKRPIEKNQGCMHITRTPPCKYEFCWLCLGAWMDHGERTGYACNRYEVAKQEGQYDETERRREMAKNSLERYTHYYERWASNQTSRQKAMTDLQQLQTHNLEKLSDKQCTPESQLKFIVEAWLQRRSSNVEEDSLTLSYGSWEAESGLEGLHQCVEKELLQFLNAEGPSKNFNDFRTKLAGLTSVTKNYFENLVKALENGLADVDSHAACSSKTTSSKSTGCSGKTRGKGKGSSRSSRSPDN
ncbi:unnamed protein product [Eruca vesicaria subsp. sativa]|uniref:RBR-type E3 ubiquitin transferase n=1 Tax=Eruca vesicaria subsp. sativa TaxID=29727 RepID=A0ABC8KZI6_ERUVS|nr:unnamed protein product [Eruca vesicaria subsp. sativa]